MKTRYRSMAKILAMTIIFLSWRASLYADTTSSLASPGIIPVLGDDLYKFASGDTFKTYTLTSQADGQKGKLDLLGLEISIQWNDPQRGRWGVLNNKLLCVRNASAHKQFCYTLYRSQSASSDCTYYLVDWLERVACLRPE